MSRKVDELKSRRLEKSTTWKVDSNGWFSSSAFSKVGVWTRLTLLFRQILFFSFQRTSRVIWVKLIRRQNASLLQKKEKKMMQNNNWFESWKSIHLNGVSHALTKTFTFDLLRWCWLWWLKWQRNELSYERPNHESLRCQACFHAKKIAN